MGELEIRAVTKYVRISPQKVRKMASVIKGKPVETAMNLLAFMPQKSADIVKKTLKSAAANAEQNTNIDIDNLVVQNLIVNQGPTLRRYRFRARGRVARILKRTSHITVILTEASA